VRLLALFVLIAALLPASTRAQPVLPPERPADLDRPAPASPLPTTPPYEAKLDRLAELMGTLAFMRDLCGKGDGTAWRDKMNDLVSSEGTSDERRNRLAGAFNRGFDSYRLTYRRCTPAAELIIDRALAEGGKLASDLSARFGG
jgi:uncharacterized protein (TIGR02301 family)